MNIKEIKKSILSQINIVSEEPWTTEDLNKEIEAAKKQLQLTAGLKLDLTKEDDIKLVLQFVVDDYEDVTIDDFAIEISLGDRLKYSDVTLEKYPPKPEGFEKFYDGNILRGKCIAGCICGKISRKYLPKGFTEKKPYYMIFMNDDSDEFLLNAYGKNDEVIEKWNNIEVGDYVEFSGVTVVEDSEENSDYDPDMEQDDMDNPKYIPNGKPKFMFWFTNSEVQKIPRDKYPELPTLYDLFEVKTMNIFLSGGTNGKGGRYIVNGNIISVKKETKQSMTCNFLVTIGNQRQLVVTTFAPKAARFLPKDKDDLKTTQLEVLGYYSVENKKFTVDKIISQKSTNKLAKATQKKIKIARGKITSKHTIEDDVRDCLGSLLEDEIYEFDIPKMQGYGFPPKYKIIQVHEALEKLAEEFGLECTNDVISEWKVITDSDEEAKQALDGSEFNNDNMCQGCAKDKMVNSEGYCEKCYPEYLEYLKEQAEENLPQIVEKNITEIASKVEESIIHAMTIMNVSNVTGIKGFVPVSYQLDPEVVSAVYEDMVKEGKIIESEGGEKIELVENDAKIPEIIDTKAENEQLIRDWFKKNNSAKGHELKILQFQFKKKIDEPILDVLTRLKDNEYKIGKSNYVIKEVKKDVWRRIKVKSV